MRAMRESWRLAWPLVLSNLSVPLLGMVDTAVVGHLPDPRHLAAVALGAAFLSAFYFLFGFLRMGTTALTGQALGAGDAPEVVASLGRGLLVAAGLGLGLGLAGPAIVGVTTPLMAPPPEAVGGYQLYVLIRLVATPAALANFVFLGWFLGLQDPHRPLLLMVFTNGLNAALAVLLVFGFGMEAGGVALATALAEYAGAAAGLALAAPRVRALGGWPSRASLLDAPALRRLVVLNRDLFLRSALLEAVFLAFAALGSRAGAVTLAANALLMHSFTLAAYGLDGFAHAAEAMVARAAGARDLDGFRAAAGAAFVNAGLLALVMSLAFWLTLPWLVALLTDQSEVRAATEPFRLYAALLPIVAVWAFVFDGIFFGAGRAGELRNGMVIAVVVFAAAAALLMPPFGNHGLWLALLAFLGARGAVLAVFYRRPWPHVMVARSLEAGGPLPK